MSKRQSAHGVPASHPMISAMVALMAVAMAVLHLS
jgi:hypothetical protein